MRAVTGCTVSVSCRRPTLLWGSVRMALSRNSSVWNSTMGLTALNVPQIRQAGAHMLRKHPSRSGQKQHFTRTAAWMASCRMFN